TASGLNRLAPVDGSVAADNLRAVLAAADAPTVVHCCAREIPFSCLTSAGASAASFDLSLLRRAEEDAFGEAVECGLGMFVGAVATLPRAQARSDGTGDGAGRPGGRGAVPAYP